MTVSGRQLTLHLCTGPPVRVAVSLNSVPISRGLFSLPRFARVSCDCSPRDAGLGSEALSLATK
eukprot:1406597-Pleurochrysis_carterae.AAC.2